MASTEDPEVMAHIHSSTAITIAQLDDFARAPREIQVRVLAKLREQTVENNVDLALFALVISVALPIVGFTSTGTVSDSPLWARVVVVCVMALLVTFLVTVVVGWTPIRNHRRRETAVVWLGAFQDELDRRNRQRGCAARKWRATH